MSTQSGAQNMLRALEERDGHPRGILDKMWETESGRGKSMKSPKGAMGHFQFIQSTGRAYGLEKDEDFYDFSKSSDAASRYLKDLVKQYGSYPDALAAYNGGGNAVKALRARKPWKETQDYLQKILGASPSEQPDALNTPRGNLRGAGSVNNVLPESALLAQQQASDEANDLPWVLKPFEAAAYIAGTTNPVVNIARTLLEQHYDPEFEWTPEREDYVAKNFSPEFYEYAFGALSDQEIKARKDRVDDYLEANIQMEKLGIPASLIGGAIASAIDPATWLMVAPGIGVSSVLGSRGLFTNIMRSAALGGAENMMAENFLSAANPFSRVQDVFMAGLYGAAFGGISGGLLSRSRTGKFVKEYTQIEDTARKQFGEEVAFIRKEMEAPAVKRTAQNMGQELPRDIVQENLLKESADIPDVRVKAAKLRAADSLDSAYKTSTKASLERIMASGTEPMRKLATKLSGYIKDDIAIRAIPDAEWVRSLRKLGGKYDSGGLRNAEGFYDPNTHSIFLRLRGGERFIQENFLHEVTHAVTYHKLMYGRQCLERGKINAHSRLYRQWDNLFQYAKKQIEGKQLSADTKYLFKDEHEFIAGLFSNADNSEFINLLASMPAPKKSGSVLSNLWAGIKRLLGFSDEEVSVLAEATGIADKIAKNSLTLEVGDILEGTSHRFLLIERGQENVGPVVGWGLSYEHLTRAKGLPQKVLNASATLIGSTIGDAAGTVIRESVSEKAVRLRGRWARMATKNLDRNFKEWLKDNPCKFFQRDAAFLRFSEEVTNCKRGLEGNYHPNVLKAVKDLDEALEDARNYLNNPLHGTNVKARGLTEEEVVNPVTGEKTYINSVEKNPSYVPRSHSDYKWTEAVRSIGREGVEAFWSGAIKQAHPDMDDAFARKLGKFYTQNVLAAQERAEMNLFEEMLSRKDRSGLREALIEFGEFSEKEVDEFMDSFFREDKAGVPSNAKRRTLLDETFQMDWQTQDGPVRVGINDFTNTNIYDVCGNYFSRMSGAVALAGSDLKIYTASDRSSFLKNMFGEMKLAGVSKSKIRRTLKAFDEILNDIQGIPREEFSIFGKSMDMLGKYNVIRLMGAAVYNQITEWGQILGSMGLRATMDAVPEVASIRRSMLDGTLNHEVLEELQAFTGQFGSEIQARISRFNTDWVKNMGNAPLARKLDKLDSMLDKGVEGLLKYSGMTPSMNFQKEAQAVAMFNTLYEMAHGTKPRTDAFNPKRLAWMGVTEKDFQEIMGNLREYAKASAVGKVNKYSVDFAKWQKNNPESYGNFMLMMLRESERTIQENKLASRIPFTGTTVGKALTQFMGFSLHAWDKSMLYAWNHKDVTTLTTLMWGTFLSTLIYMTRTYADSLGYDGEKRKEFLEKRLSFPQIVANSVGRLPQASITPDLVDTFSPYAVFSGRRTTSDASGFFANPAVQGMDAFISMYKNVFLAGTDEDAQITERDIRAYKNLLPFAKFWGLSQMYDRIASQYPNSERQE